PWLKRVGPDRRGAPVPIDLTTLTRWQIVDNLRRSLVAPALVLLLLLAPVLPGEALRRPALAPVTLLLPVVRVCLAPLALVRRPRSLTLAFGHAAVAFVTLPYQAALMMDAVLRTLYRLFVSKRGLLEWVSQADVERASARGGAPALVGMGA